MKKLGVVLSTYSQNYYYEIISAYVAAYILFVYFEFGFLFHFHFQRDFNKLIFEKKINHLSLQSFAIPGSASLSLLGGALFGFNTGMFLVCLVIFNF